MMARTAGSTGVDVNFKAYMQNQHRAAES